MASQKHAAPVLEPLPPIQSDRRYPIALALRYEGVCRATFYKELAAGNIKTITVGKRRFVGGAELLRRMGAPTASAPA
jgi:hypothetical protein